MVTNPLNQPTVLIRLPNWVGDVVMSLPAIKRLGALNVPLVLCGRPWAKSILKNIQYADFIELNGSLLHDFKAIKRFVQTMPSTPFVPLKEGVSPRLPRCVGITLPDSLSSAMIFALNGIPTLGYRDDGRSILLKWPIPKPDATRSPYHAVQKWFFLADQAARIWSDQFELPPPPISAGTELPDTIHIDISSEQMDRARSHLSQALGTSGAPFILIAPTATGRHHGQIKVWPQFEALTQALEQKGYRVLACPPQHEQDQARAAAPSARILAPTDLGTFAALTKLALLTLCNDSGVSHIAAAAGAHQITLFGVTDPEHTRAWSTQVHNLGTKGRWPTLAEVLTCVEACLAQQPSEPNAPPHELAV